MEQIHITKEKKELEARFLLAIEKTVTALKYVTIDSPEYKSEFITPSEFVTALQFAFDFVVGKTDFPSTNFKVDLTPFGYRVFGKTDETPPTSYDELVLVPIREFIPKEYHWHLMNTRNWQVPESFLANSKACGQVVAEWLAGVITKMPTSWKEGQRGLLYCPGSWWFSAEGKRTFSCLGTGRPFPARLGFVERDLGLMEGAHVVCWA